MCSPQKDEMCHCCQGPGVLLGVGSEQAKHVVLALTAFEWRETDRKCVNKVVSSFRHWSLLAVKWGTV